MLKYKNVQFILSFVLLTTLFIPHSAHAAITYVTADADSVKVGDTVGVEVRLNSEGQSVNVVEGDLQINSPDGLMIREISISGSSISLWSRKPSLSEDKRTISFAGGSPGGFSEPNALLFKVFFTAQQVGTASFIPRDIKAYLNDGKGTLTSQSLKSFTTKVVAPGPNYQVKDDWTRIVSSDNMPPEFLAATPGQDDDTFGDKTFLMIQGSDYQSGIDHYEVKEGNSDFIRSGNVYVLQDQTLSVPLTIRAVDKAGNIRTLVIEPSFAKKYRKGIFVFGGIILIGIVVVILALLKKKKNKK